MGIAGQSLLLQILATVFPHLSPFLLHPSTDGPFGGLTQLPKTGSI